MINKFKQKRSSKPALAIAVGGVVAGALDLTQAMILFGKNIPLAIAGGLLGPRAFQGGAGFYILGVLLFRRSLFHAARVPNLSRSGRITGKGPPLQSN
jgi:hypothetical protein